MLLSCFLCMDQLLRTAHNVNHLFFCKYIFNLINFSLIYFDLQKFVGLLQMSV